ncbi:hypothetical protein AB4Y63_08845 [Leifsonia sp. YAF41]|uniref:type IV toxin-antitoxin system AbiEi family antitoxin domain-containing protein n=1 Tax=Leifsonia sp. YAF41 TaxID=3233086 RepID=UPI003F9C33D7
MNNLQSIGPTLVLARDLKLVGNDARALRRGLVAGHQARLLRGVYVSAEVWNTADDDARYLMRITAAVLTRKSYAVVSHLSAARIWGLPIFGRWPSDVHLTALGGRTRESKNGIRWHHEVLSEGDVVEIDGMLVTSRLRTMVDLARTTSFASAVASLDSGLCQKFTSDNGMPDSDISTEELSDAIRRLGSRRGCRPAKIAADFADGASGSAGESVSRAHIFLSGMPAPRLQVVYARVDGGKDIVDFTWDKRHHVRSLPLLGEFDGKMKYTRGRYMNGRTIEEVVWDEKVRQDRLCAPGRAMVRWLWGEASRPAELRALLIEAGLKPER